MARMITEREQQLDVTNTAVLRIMRFLPVTIPMTLRVEPTVESGASRGERSRRVLVGGTIKAGGFGARLTYRRVERGTSLPLEETSSELLALRHDRTLPIEPQELDWDELGRPPDLWIQYVNGDDSPIAPRTRLGRCDEGPFDLNPSLPLNLFVDAAVVRGETFDLNPLSDLAISGDVSIRSGIAARLTLSPGDSAGAPSNGHEAAVAVQLIPDDTIIHLPRRPLRSPLGRDSWIYLAFLDGSGRVTGGEALLGRAQLGLDQLQSGGVPLSRVPASPIQ
jgi:hypothetical protein